MKQEHIIKINDFSKDDLIEIFDLAREMEYSSSRYTNYLQGKVVATLFFEPSTRTKDSFESAVKQMGGKTVGFDSQEGSSLSKGEKLSDTITMYASYAHAIAMRHPLVGSAKLASEYSIKPNTNKTVPIINGGDGDNQHPTQTMLDLFTIKKELGKLEGLSIGIVGDLRYGRTTHSLLYGAAMFGMNISLVSPEITRMPNEYLDNAYKSYGAEIKRFGSIDDVIEDVDVLYMTRVQKERFPDLDEYKKVAGRFILKPKHMEKAKEKMIVMHPLPRVNEIDTRIDQDPRASYFRQAENGVPIRMALLKLLEVGK